MLPIQRYRDSLTCGRYLPAHLMASKKGNTALSVLPAKPLLPWLPSNSFIFRRAAHPSILYQVCSIREASAVVAVEGGAKGLLRTSTFSELVVDNGRGLMTNDCTLLADINVLTFSLSFHRFAFVFCATMNGSPSALCDTVRHCPIESLDDGIP